MHEIHDVSAFWRAINSILNLHNLIVHAKELVGEPQYYGTSSGRGRMGCFLQDVLASEAPMSPSKIANLVQRMKVQH